jgi:hypothetical protein
MSQTMTLLMWDIQPAARQRWIDALLLLRVVEALGEKSPVGVCRYS